MSDWIELRTFQTRSEASAAASDLLADLLRGALVEKPREQASLIVSGGSTPGPCFDQLSGEDMDWSRVTVIPSDERYVPAQHDDSNEKLIRERLLIRQARAGSVLPFYRDGVDAESAPAKIE